MPTGQTHPGHTHRYGRESIEWQCCRCGEVFYCGDGNTDSAMKLARPDAMQAWAAHRCPPIPTQAEIDRMR